MRGGDRTLYFAYTSIIAPHRMKAVAPGAEFQFIAHLPETRLVFPASNGKWNGGLPSLRPEPGNTVWGAIFEVPEEELAAIDRAEEEEGRARTVLSAMDRGGRRHGVVSHAVADHGPEEVAPAPDYMAIVVEGCRHWDLPAGWVAGLEEYVEGTL